jgi:hypothetical protein
MPRWLELLEYLDRVGDIDFAIRPAVGRIAQFADAGVARAGVVPTMRSFLGQLIGDLIQLDAQFGFQAF